MMPFPKQSLKSNAASHLSRIYLPLVKRSLSFSRKCHVEGSLRNFTLGNSLSNRDVTRQSSSIQMSLGNSNNKLSSAIPKLRNCSNWASAICAINVVSEWLIEFISIIEKRTNSLINWYYRLDLHERRKRYRFLESFLNNFYFLNSYN